MENPVMETNNVLEYADIKKILPHRFPFLLVDRVVGYVAPALLGAGAAAVGDLGAGTISAALRLRLDEAVRVGDDVRLTLRPTAGTSADTTTTSTTSTPSTTTRTTTRED